MGQAGQEGGRAVVDILTGKVTPSGKLAATWAEKYEDYPTSDVFLRTRFRLPIRKAFYVGYRYFDTFDKQPGYPFGYGLSYTTFSLDGYHASLDGDVLTLSVDVTNTGNLPGKEVIQLYVSAPVTELDMPAHELKGFQKTDSLLPGAKQTVTIRVPVESLASYSTAHGGYILSKVFIISVSAPLPAIRPRYAACRFPKPAVSDGWTLHCRSTAAGRAERLDLPPTILHGQRSRSLH